MSILQTPRSIFQFEIIYFFLNLDWKLINQCTRITTNMNIGIMYASFFWCQAWSLLLFFRKRYLGSILNIITPGSFACVTFSSVAMFIGTLLVCLNAPKKSGTFFFSYILRIQYSQNSNKIVFYEYCECLVSLKKLKLL